MNNSSFASSAALAIIVWVAVTAITTTASADHLGTVQQDLNDHLQQWQALGIDSYDFRLQRSCFCGDSTQPGLVYVRNGQINSVTHAVTSDPLDPADYLTVNDLFQEAQDAIDFHAAEVILQYDSTLAYPTLFSVDFILQFLDDEIAYHATQLRAVPEPHSIVLLLIGIVPFLRVARGRQEE